MSPSYRIVLFPGHYEQGNLEEGARAVQEVVIWTTTDKCPLEL